jgi:hypothetical protein
MTATTQTAKPKKPAPRHAAATNATSVKLTKKANDKIEAAKSQTNNLMVTPQRPASVLEDLSDLLYNLPLQACVELTPRQLTSIPFLPLGVVRPHTVLKPVILFLA